MNLGRLSHVGSVVFPVNREEAGIRCHLVGDSPRHLLHLYSDISHERLTPPAPDQLIVLSTGTPARNIAIAALALSECVPTLLAGKTRASPY